MRDDRTELIAIILENYVANRLDAAKIAGDIIAAGFKRATK